MARAPRASAAARVTLGYPRGRMPRVAAPAAETAPESRLVQAGVVLALVLPFVVFSTASSDALRESKVFAQAIGSSLALFGLAAAGAWGFVGDESRRGAARLAPFALAAALVLALASAAANARVVDPLVLGAVLSPLALLAAGASRTGAAIAARAAAAVCVAGAFSGALAATQRWLGILRMPLDAPQPRFFAAGLVGNPGDLAMALVVPAVLLFAAATTQRDIGLLAALEMIRSHPLAGIGPGAFSNAFVPARIAAEERSGRRLVHRSGSAHFDNAHSEPLTLAAECGVPAAAAGAAGLLLLAAGLLGARRAPGAGSNPATDALIAALAAGFVLSLGGFPLRLPVASGPLAFLLGLAWRRAAPGRRAAAPLPAAARASFAAAGAVLLAIATVRSAAVSSQADGETLLRDAASAPDDAGPAREELLSASKARLKRAVALRPREATAILALGSVSWLEKDLDEARSLYARSLALEERAESDLNLGRVELALGRREASDALFRRAVWILPRLADDLPPGVDRARIAAEVDAAAAGLARGGRAPGLPAAR